MRVSKFKIRNVTRDFTNFPGDRRASDSRSICSANFPWVSNRSCDNEAFSPVVNDDLFFVNYQALSSGKAELFDAELLMSAIAIKNYKKIVIAIGDSDHHAYIFEILKKLRSFNLMDRVVLYVHDPNMLNIIKCNFSGDETAFVKTLSKLYQEPLNQVAKGDWFPVFGITGVRIFAENGIKHILVNSEAARKILTDDLSGYSVSIKKLFHPVFLPDVCGLPHNILGEVGKRVEKPISVGSFGIPSISKRTNTVIAACEELLERNVSIKLIIAGFGAADYVASYLPLRSNLTIEAYGDLSDSELATLMSSVDVAVQLRRNNQGESSGVVSQLLSLGKNVIVSDIGAFSEYGDAVYTVPAKIAAKPLAEVILGAVGDQSRRSAIRDYVDSHTVMTFQRALIESCIDCK